MLLKEWLQFLYDADKGGSGGGNGGDPPDPPDPDNGDNGDEGDNGDNGDDGDSDDDLNGDFDSERAMATIKAQRAERRGLRQELSTARKALKKLEDADKERERAKMGETERLEDELGELTGRYATAQEQLRLFRLDQAFRAAVDDLEIEFVNHQAGRDAFALMDLADFEIDDSGQLDGKVMAKAVKALQASRPHLFGTPKPGHGTPPRGRGSQPPPATPPPGGEGEMDKPLIQF